ncbi:hypothetical protein NGI46_07320 [Peribacillus butanolivorans]|uniref:Cap15 family cyclic dinucleotide receptor domain-containing protein n=1 Tax=Peribacillus butanolivorans TaxID=421767 RepID=UPI00207D1B5E|nr:hypothetical protein [Peribacillus butanolivorans]MCO0597278.1 hypothetical protein [Peribacillus butanolivorans]
MHQYSVDYDRKLIYFLLVSISISITSLINYVFTVSHIVISVTSFTIFGLIFLLFDKFFWKWRVLHKLGIVKTPNLIGMWEGVLSSSYHEFKEEMPACIVIKQTWTHIFVSGNFNQSKSYSISANLETNNGARTILRYVYMNQNNLAKSDGTMSSHSGITTLEFSLEEGVTEGKYYNEQPQNVNYGVLHLKKHR